MEFIEEDGTDFGKGSVVLKPAEKDAFGDKDDAGVGAGFVVEADLIADLGSELTFSL